MSVTLRYYQQHAVERFIAALRAGTRRVLLVSPTGSGKGTIAAYLLHQTWRQGRRGLFIVHRIELAQDMVKRVLGMGCTSVGVIVADDVVRDEDGRVLARNDPHALVQIATTDTLRGRELPRADLIVQDEAHRSVNKSTITIHQAYPNAKVVGLSVGPSSVVELRGGVFGAGWIGRVEDAFSRLGDLPVALVDEYDVVDMRGAGVQTRGWNGTEFCWKSVRSVVRHPCVKDVRFLRLASGNLMLTDDHSVYVARGKARAEACLTEVPTADIRVGDIVPVDDGSNWDDVNETPYSFLDAADRAMVAVDLSNESRISFEGVDSKNWYNFRHAGRHGHYLPMHVYRKHKHRLQSPTMVYTEGARGHWVLPEIKLSAWAYILGFYVGDGWCHGGRISFAVENWRLDHFLSKLGEVSGVGWSWRVKQTPNKSVEVRISMNLVANMLVKMFGGARSHKKNIPHEWITTWPRSARLELLRGLIDSDGHPSHRDRNRSRAHYVTTSLPLAESLLSLLRSVGVSGSLHTRKASPGSLGGIVNGRQIVSRHTAYNVHWSLHSMNGDNGGCRGARTRFRHDKIRFNESVVRAAEPTDRPSYVYDLEVDGHPSFVANGVLVHNTASPIRLDRRGLDEAFDELVVVATPSELIAAGHIVQTRVFTVPADQLPDLSDVKTSDGDYNQKQLAKAVTRKVLVGYIVDHWRRRADGLKTMVFATSIEHSKLIVVEFLAAGIEARHVDGKTPKDERKKLVADHKARVFPVLVQCNLLVEGYDDPEIECVVLARPTKSLNIYLQAVGRLSRPCGNKQVIVLDHAGNANVHGLPEADREWSLEGPPKRKPKEGAEVAARTCPMCYMVVPAATAVCPSCGHEFAPDVRKPPQTVEGELVELKADPALERRSFWAMAWGRSYREGHPPSWVYGRYRDKFHEEPPDDWTPAPRPDANFTQEQKDAELRKLRAAAARNRFSASWVVERYQARFGEPPRAMNADVHEVTATQTPPATAASEAVAAPAGEVYEEMF